MPFMEVSDFGGPLEARKAVAKRGTEALVEAFHVSPDIVSCYFHDSSNAYAHAGKFGADADKKRIFVKIHAFRRPRESQDLAARLLTDAFEVAYSQPRGQIAIYFIERDRADAYHGGVSQDDVK